MFHQRPPDDGKRSRKAATELDLVRRSQQGDRAAFNQLLEQHQGVAYALALRMLGEPETAADVTQEAFLSAFRAISSFSGTSFRAWLMRIVSNACYDVFRRRGRRAETSLDALLDPADDTASGASDAALPSALVDADNTPERTALRVEVVETIQAALLELPDDQRLAVILSDVQGMRYDEIATILNVPIGTVKSRIARGRTQLRVLLTRDGELFTPAERPASEST